MPLNALMDSFAVPVDKGVDRVGERMYMLVRCVIRWVRGCVIGWVKGCVVNAVECIDGLFGSA